MVGLRVSGPNFEYVFKLRLCMSGCWGFCGACMDFLDEHGSRLIEHGFFGFDSNDFVNIARQLSGVSQ